MAQPPPGYKSHVYIPIRKDDKSFEERQRSIWDEMHSDIDKDFMRGHSQPVGAPVGGSGSIWDDMHSTMDAKRKDWEGDVEKMRREFFKLAPSDASTGDQFSSNGHNAMVPGQTYVDKGEGNKAFRVSFDVSQFKADEISVRTQDNKLIVHAKHEEKGEGKNVSREFSRQVDIPKHVDPQRLSSTLSKDGILQVEAPVMAPSYNRVCESQGHLIPTENSGIQRQTVGLTSSAPPANPQFMSQMPLLQTSGLTNSSGAASPGFKTGPVVTEEDGVRRMKIVLDIGLDYKPEEVLVKTVNRKLQISAKHEEKKEGRTTMREFSKELDLPDDIDPSNVTASVSEDGKLVVEAPISSYTQGSYQGAPGSKKQPEISVAFS